MSATSGGAPHYALIAAGAESTLIADRQAAGAYQSEERSG